MTQEILIILACVPLYVINSFCDKIASTKGQNKYNPFYNAIKFLICSICMIPVLLLDGAPLCARGSLLCGIACGVMYAISKTVMLKGYEMTSVTFMTLCHSSGMILPCIIGHFFWTEKLNILSIGGIILAILSIVLLKSDKGEGKQINGKGVLLGAIIFFTSAGVMLTQKLMGIYFSDQSVGAYNAYSFFSAFCILCCFVKPAQIRSSDKKEKKSIYLCAAGSAVSLSIIGFVMTSLSGAVPSIILFPLFNGLGIIFVCIGSVFAFREKFTSQKVIGLVVGLLGLCLVNF